jgi:hypothetical protein
LKGLLVISCKSRKNWDKRFTHFLLRKKESRYLFDEIPIKIGISDSHTFYFAKNNRAIYGEIPMKIGISDSHTFCFTKNNRAIYGEIPMKIGISDSHTFCFAKSGSLLTYFFYTDRLLRIKQQLFALAYTL